MFLHCNEHNDIGYTFIHLQFAVVHVVGKLGITGSNVLIQTYYPDCRGEIRIRC